MIIILFMIDNSCKLFKFFLNKWDFLPVAVIK